jgi:phosphoribosylaminoimidazole-succinocarboxamide synthase
MEKRDLLYEGKAKKVYQTDDPDLLIQFFKDDATAFNAQKKGTIASKGVFNNKISEHFFKRLEEAGVATHFVKRLSDREMLIRRLRMFPVEVVVRNRIAGSLA